MSKHNKQSQYHGKKFTLLLGAGVIVLAAVLFAILGTGTQTGSSSVAEAADLTITKTDVSEKAEFYPYQAGDTKMELLAVKASDGTIRTAFNTCQVCFGSGRAYYVQEGNELVCQNCGNRFALDQVEIQRGGCNPVPIFEDNKEDTGDSIVISGDYLQQNQKLFTNWKTR